MFSVPVFVYVAKLEYKRILKNILNLQGFKKFPILTVTTTCCNEKIKGKIKDIFDKKLLVLEDEGTIKIILWENVCNLEYQKENFDDPRSQTNIFDYI